jgi:hypothetical protein
VKWEVLYIYLPDDKIISEASIPLYFLKAGMQSFSVLLIAPNHSEYAFSTLQVPSILMSLSKIVLMPAIIEKLLPSKIPFDRNPSFKLIIECSGSFILLPLRLKLPLSKIHRCNL